MKPTPLLDDELFEISESFGVLDSYDFVSERYLFLISQLDQRLPRPELGTSVPHIALHEGSYVASLES